LLQADHSTIDMSDHDGFTPLIHSIRQCQTKCVNALIEAGARIDPLGDSDYIPLNLACQRGCVAIAELLLQRGAKILVDAEGLYPQHHVARSGLAPHLFNLLKQYGADLNTIDKMNGWTAMLHA